MKNVFKMLCYSLCLSIMMVGCENQMENEPQSKPSKYEVCVDLGIDEYIALGFNTELNVAFFEYNEKNEMVYSHTWYDVYDGESRTFTANKRSTKIVIKVELMASYGSTIKELNFFLAQVFYLEPGSTIGIDVNGHSRTSEWSPI
ncbi:MAG: hypothetical protein J6U91_01705 [Alistipes sp.]|nr:hypothetical protein [Alistipes sp.]